MSEEPKQPIDPELREAVGAVLLSIMRRRDPRRTWRLVDPERKRRRKASPAAAGKP